MKVGDLVKMKWTTFVNIRNAKKRGYPVDVPGIVMEEVMGAVKVMFPSHGKKIYTLLKESVEVISEC